MKELERAYLSGTAPVRAIPLARFLPPYAPGVMTAWLREQVSGGQWLLDPLGSNPLAALEAARAGFRVLVASNNPVLAFILETLAGAPHPADFNAALAELSAARRGNERLQVHLESLYATACPHCGQTIQAQAFLWRREEQTPFARLIHCLACGAEGDFPVTDDDLERLARLGSDPLHRSRALERVVAPGDNDREAVEEALKSYLPRPLYVLFTLINKTEGIGIAAPGANARRRLLTALMLSLCDEASSLWPWPAARARPRQLSIPPIFRENNLWLALETAAAQWAGEEPAVPVTRWPERPPETGGVCLYPGRLRSLLPLPEDLAPAAVIGVLPRPNQAFWTLSALWAGWLWGREAVQPLKFAFERQRYEWGWHAGALFNVLAPLNAHLPPGTPVFSTLPELAPSFLSATLTAARAAGLRTSGFALDGERDNGQIEWRTAAGQPARPHASLETRLREGIREHLANRGEPDSYLALHAAGMLQAAAGGALPAFQPKVSAETFEQVQGALARVFSDLRLLVRYAARKEASAESGLYALAHDSDPAAPLADRVEGAVTAFLQARKVCSLLELARVMNAAFPGLQTPSLALLQACLEATAAPETGGSGTYRLLPETIDADGARAALLAIAERPGLHLSGEETPLVWKTARGRTLLAFFIIEGAIASPALLAEPPAPPEQCVIVFPAGHAALLAYKLERDPRLAARAAGWRYLTYEKLAELAAAGRVSVEEVTARLERSPLGSGDATQIRML